MNEKNTTIRQSAGQNTVGDYNTTAPSPACSVAVNAVNGVNAAKPPDAVEAAAATATTTTTAATAASPPAESRFQPLVPLKGQEGNLPPFPIDRLPTVLHDYVRAVAEHSQTAVDMAAVIGLGVLAVCLQGKYVVEGSPGYREPLSLYTVVIAPPGERKSSVMRDMTQSLYDYEREFNEGRQAEIRRNRQERESLERYISGLQEKLRHSTDDMLELELQHMEAQLEEMPVIKPVRFFADDCSSEALTNLLANNDGVLSVISTEGGIFDIMAGRYNSRVNIDVWLKGHCGDAIRVDRLGREPEYIPNPALSAILTIQPVVLDEIMSNATMAGRGLIARFLYASPPSMIGGRRFCTPEIPAEIKTAYKEMIYRLMAIPKPDKPAVLTLTPHATDVIAHHFHEHEIYLSGEGQMISDWAGKYIGAVLRIAGLLHVAEPDRDDCEVSSDTMRRAIEIGKYFLAHSAYAYSMTGNDLSIKKAQFVLGKLKKGRITSIKRWELAKLCRGKFFKKSEDLYPTLELLQSCGYILQTDANTQSTPGRRPDILVLVNPAVYQSSE